MRKITSFIDGAWREARDFNADVRNKFQGEPIARLATSSPDDIQAAVDSSLRAFEGPGVPLVERIAIFHRVAASLEARKQEFAETICAESGSTINEATREVERTTLTLRETIEEAKRNMGELVPLEGVPGGSGKFAFTLRYPVGVVCAITAFNSPLNTPIHKVAPALAAGNSVILKPPTQTPISSAMLCDLFAEAGLPPGWLNYVIGGGSSVGEQLINDPRISFYHFTGSTAVGRRIAARIGLRRSSLELGSIAATIVCADADINSAIKEIVRSGYAKAGQVCTSTQIVLVQEQAFDLVRDGLERAVRNLKCGDPRSSTTNVGPLISVEEAKRVGSWIDEAESRGGRRLCGGDREGAVLRPALLTGVPSEAKLISAEVFGPVVSLISVSSVEEAVKIYNRTPYGLAVGIFTSDIGRAFYAVRNLRAGTVHINSSSSSRLDVMPFGGVKDSGHGKEGPRYAIQEMTERRLAVWHGV
jgi:succinate-semialdehyde dehydrogenase / glutarate-semialdehyde dehydrogenase